MLHCEIMKKQTYYGCLALILAVMVLALGFGMTTGNLLVPVIIIACAVGAIWLCHRRVTDVMTDDLESAISGKAALKALEVTVIVAAIVFAITTGFYFNGSRGIGMHGFENGSVLIHANQVYSGGQIVYDKYYFIADPGNLSMDDVLSLNQLFTNSHRVREFPLAFGVALGCMVVFLVGLYAAFSYYYTKKYEE
nr:DUF2178 domain-containing protein [uncultured Methanoregula sp.]